MKTPLFKETSFESREAEETIQSREEEETYPDDNVKGVMEDGLVQVTEIITTNHYKTSQSEST